MYELFFHKLTDKVNFSQDELGIIREHLKLKRVRRKQYLLQEGDVCKFIAFVEKGAMRSYSIDEKGNEHILQFALDGWIISDLFSFLTGEPSTYNMDAIEDCEVVLISKASHEELLKLMWNYDTYIRMEITSAYIAMQRRITSIIGSSLEERYAAFNSLYPEIVQRVPQHMIASYMGLTPETLSRVRNKRVRK